MAGLSEDYFVRLRGSAGQPGACHTGACLEVIGANDCWKGLVRRHNTVRPAAAVNIVASANTIIGNTVLYGATSGKLLLQEKR